MEQYIPKAAVLAEIERRLKLLDNAPAVDIKEFAEIMGAQYYELTNLAKYINTLEVKDPYEECIQYPSVKDGIKAHAETYSFNIESELFNQLTKEQQALWRKEIEQACISGSNVGVELARDTRYKENFETKEVDLEKELNDYGYHYDYVSLADRKELVDFAKHFFELGLKAHK